MHRRVFHEKPQRVWGPEPWATVGDAGFTYWDLWFLALAIHRGGFEPLRQALEETRDHGWHGQRDAEAKLSHLADLEERVAALGMAPHEVVDGPPNKALLRKAKTKVFDQAVPGEHKTKAMIQTPAHRLQARALRGHWHRFPASPAKFEPIFTEEVEKRRGHSMTATWRLTQRLRKLWAGETSTCGPSAAAVLALHRALMTVLVETVPRVDASGGDIGTLFSELLEHYIEVNWTDAGIDPGAYVEDFIDFVVWEDYALVDDTVSFFAGIDVEFGDLVSRTLQDRLAELERAQCNHARAELIQMWAEFLVVHSRFDEFVPLAQRAGSERWRPIETLAHAAYDSREFGLCRAVFQAANQPGLHQKTLAEECRKLLGSSPPPPGSGLRAI